MESHTIGIALFAYLPAISAGFSLYLICKYCASVSNHGGHWGTTIPAVVLTAGFVNATWKLIYVLTEVNYRWMFEQLYFLHAAAYVFMAVLVFSSIRVSGKGRELAADWWYSPALVALILLVTAQVIKLKTDSEIWSVMLFATLFFANFVMLITLTFHSVKARAWVAAGAFASSLLLGYVLLTLARTPEQTAQLMWTEQVLSLINYSMLAIGAWTLLRIRKRDAYYKIDGGGL